MIPDLLGLLERDGKRLTVSEVGANLKPDAQNFKVELGIGDQALELDLEGVRKAKLLLAEGERVLVARHHQAVLNKNLSFDFDK
jgi:hypothetical protein